MNRLSRYVLAVAFLSVSGFGSSTLRAATIALPNGSFESPGTTFAAPFLDAWQQVPQPDLGVPATLVTGVFSNQPPTDPSHIDNCDGSQGAFLFANPQVALFQDYDSTDYANPAPTHAFNARFEVGKSYSLTVGVLGGTNLAIPMQEGTTLELSLYYRDSLSNQVTVAAISITNSGALFPIANHFVDFEVQVPTVRPSDAWAGQQIGVRLLSTLSDTNLLGGYWDLDNVRLTSTLTPVLTAPTYANGQCSFTLQSEPGLRFEILATTNITMPLSNWFSLGTLTNITGATVFLDPATNLNRRFYRARWLP